MVETPTLNVGTGNTMTLTAGGLALTGAMTIANRAVADPYVTILAGSLNKKTTNLDPIKVTLATANLTAGKCRFIVGYYEPLP